MSASKSVLDIFNSLSKRWVLLILCTLHDRVHTFNAIKKHLKSISSRTLSDRLRELEMNGFIERRAGSHASRKIEYHLSKKGEDLKNIINAMTAWGEKWQKSYPRN